MSSREVKARCPECQMEHSFRVGTEPEVDSLLVLCSGYEGGCGESFVVRAETVTHIRVFKIGPEVDEYGVTRKAQEVEA